MVVLTRDQLAKLSHEELLDYTIRIGDLRSDLGTKIDMIEKCFTDKFEELRVNYEQAIREIKMESTNHIAKLEGELAIVKNANELLKADTETKSEAMQTKLIELERETQRTSQYTQYETLEFSKIPLTIPDSEVQPIILKIVNAIKPDGSEKLTDHHIQACHHHRGKFTHQNVLLKLVVRGNVHTILKQRLKLRNMIISETIDQRLTEPVYINDHLTPYYAKLRYDCKKLFQAGCIHKFWVSGHKVKIQLVEGGSEKLITHSDDFRVLLPEVDLSQVLLV